MNSYVFGVPTKRVVLFLKLAPVRISLQGQFPVFLPFLPRMSIFRSSQPKRMIFSTVMFLPASPRTVSFFIFPKVQTAAFSASKFLPTVFTFNLIPIAPIKIMTPIRTERLLLALQPSFWFSILRPTNRALKSDCFSKSFFCPVFSPAFTITIFLLNFF